MKKTLCALFLIVFFWSSGTYASNETPSGKAASTVITSARYLLNESSAGFWSDAELLVYLNDGVRRIVALSGCSEVSERKTLNTGTSEYAISASHIGVADVIYQTGVTSFRSLKRGDRSEIGYSGTGEPEYYYVNMGNIGIYPMTDDENVTTTGNTIYVIMTIMQEDIGSTDIVPIPAGYDSALLYWIAAKALAKDTQEWSGQYENMFLTEMQFWTTYYNQGRKELWKIIRPLNETPTQ